MPRRVIVTLLGPVRWAPPGVDLARWRAALAEDVVDLLAMLNEVDFCNARGTVRHFDVRFLARLGENTEPVVSDESLDLQWFPVDDVPTDEPDMLDLIRLARARVLAGG